MDGEDDYVLLLIQTPRCRRYPSLKDGLAARFSQSESLRAIAAASARDGTPSFIRMEET